MAHSETTQAEQSTAVEQSRAARWWTPDRLRLAGVAAIIGGLVFPILNGIEDVFYPQITEATGTLGFAVYFAIVTTAALCLLVGVIGLYAYARRSYGYLGIGGTIIASIGFACIAIAGVVIIVTNAPGQGSPGQLFGAIGYLSTFLSAAIVGIALWRAHVGLRIAAGLLVLSFLVFVAELMVWEPILFYYPFGVGWVLIGYTLWSHSQSTETIGADANIESAT